MLVNCCLVEAIMETGIHKEIQSFPHTDPAITVIYEPFINITMLPRPMWSIPFEEWGRSEGSKPVIN